MTGKLCARDDLVVFQGHLVSAEGKQILSERLSGGGNTTPRQRLVEVAQRHRGLRRVIIVYAIVVTATLVACVFWQPSAVIGGLFFLAVVVWGIVAVRRLSYAHGRTVAWIFPSLFLLGPPLGFIVLLVLSESTAKELRAAGLRVGFMGVSKACLAQVQHPEESSNPTAKPGTTEKHQAAT